jgi:hypothetical protein
MEGPSQMSVRPGPPHRTGCPHRIEGDWPGGLPSSWSGPSRIDLLRSMFKTFVQALMSAGRRRLRRPVPRAQRETAQGAARRFGHAVAWCLRVLGRAVCSRGGRVRRTPILVDHAAEDVDAVDSPSGSPRGGVNRCRYGRLEVHSPVGPAGVEVLNVGMQDSLQMGAVPDEHPVQALGADRAHEPFGHRGRKAPAEESRGPRNTDQPLCGNSLANVASTRRSVGV